MNPSRPEQKYPTLPPSNPASTTGTKPLDDGNAGVTAEARATAEDLKAQGEKAAADVKDAGAEIAAAAQQKAEDLAERGKEAGAERGEGLAGAARRVADDLEDTSPEIARHVRGAADSISGVAASLRERSVGDLLNEVSGFARRQPAAFFGAAVLAGFAITRFAKSSAETTGAGHRTGTWDAGYQAGNVPQGRAPEWVPDTASTDASGTAPIQPATVPAATLGGAAAHQSGAAKPGSMPTLEGSSS